MGKSSSSGHSTQTVTQELSPEEKELLGVQTDFLKDTYPRINASLDEAVGAYDASVDETGRALNIARQGTEEARFVGSAGLPAYGTGLSALSNLYGDQYAQDQLDLATRPVEQRYAQARQATANQFAGAGQPNSRRAATAQALGDAAFAGELGNVQAGVRSNIEGLRADQASNLVSAGERAIDKREGYADKELAYANLPLQLAGSLAGVLSGAPRDQPDWNRDTTTAGSQSKRGSDFKATDIAKLFISDATAKSDIKFIDTVGGINFYSYYHEVYNKYEIGVLAQEIQEIIPAAVGRVGKWLAVDYNKVFKHIQEV